MTAPAGRWVRIEELRHDPDGVDLLITAIEEWAVAAALVMIHGREAGARRYIEAGGHVRLDHDGEPVIWRPA